MSTRNLLYKRSYPLNQHIKIVIPTVGEILENEDKYYGLISSFTAMPIDMMVQLDDAGIDFAKINEYELFLLLFNGIKLQDTTLLFDGLDLTKFEFSISEQNGTPILIDKENDIIIDRAIHGQIAAALRLIHHLEKNRRKPGNEEAKKYLIERARVKMRRKKNRVEDSQIESLIIAMVCTEQYKYNYEETLDLSIYQFNESARQIIKKVDYDHRMYGVYTGNIDIKKVSQDDLNWLIHK